MRRCERVKYEEMKRAQTVASLGVETEKGRRSGEEGEGIRGN
jgi:hypothetical protein